MSFASENERMDQSWGEDERLNFRGREREGAGGVPVV